MKANPPQEKTRIEAQLAALKQALASEIADILEARQLTQTEAAYIMRDAPSQVSLVVTGKLHGFSLERLLRMLALLAREITVLTAPAKGKVGKVSKVGRLRVLAKTA